MNIEQWHATVLADPDSESTRLAYSDWLEENNGDRLEIDGLRRGLVLAWVEVYVVPDASNGYRVHWGGVYTGTQRTGLFDLTEVNTWQSWDGPTASVPARCYGNVAVRSGNHIGFTLGCEPGPRHVFVHESHVHIQGHSRK